MNRIASDEPDEVGLAPVPITFWFRGREYHAAVSRTGLRIDRLTRAHGCVYELRGDYGRAWLADPCTMALDHGLHAGRLQEDAQRKADRADRRRAKEAQAAEEAAARRVRVAKW